MTVSVQLTQGKVALIDEGDLALVSRYSWSYYKESRKKTGYAMAWVEGKVETMHRLIKGFPASRVDHHNGNGIDNRRTNLRLASNGQNQANRASLNKNNSSGYKGVNWDTARSKWAAKIRVDYKTKFLGRFSSAEEAAQAYDRAAMIHFGEFASLNFPRSCDVAGVL